MSETPLAPVRDSTSEGARTPGVASRAGWVLLALFCAATFGRSLPAAFRPAPDRYYDFFKEWTTARNVQEGRPAYANLREAFQREVLDREPGAGRAAIGHFDEYNTHPPASAWLAWPFRSLEYRDAHFAFNVVSLALFAAGVACLAIGWKPRPTLLDWLILGGLLCACDPFRQSLIQGQPNLVMFGLLAFAWRMCASAGGASVANSTRRFAGGFAIGIATALKLFPGLLGVRALVMRRWMEAAGAAAGFGLVSLSTLALVGFEGYSDYLQKALPWARSQTNNWGNVSILAFWERLLGEPNATIQPWLSQPAWGRGLAWGCSLLVVAWLVWFWDRCRRRGDVAARGEAFAAAIFGMLLLSPMVWVHTLLLAGVAWAILREIRGSDPSSRGRAAALWLVVVCLWLSPRLMWNLAIPAGRTRTAHSWQSATALSYQTYALFGGLLVSGAACAFTTRRRNVDL